MVINERQTCNFSQPENFVVFECVHRLLEKGYKPEHIELEPEWKVGRGASGGRADILIKNNFSKPLLIIECKTFGPEFKKAWSKTQQDGDQLFSYAQQISETQFLCLYASSFEKKPQYQSQIIAHRDNEQYLAANPSLPSFSNAKDVKERFAVWRDTYQLNYTTQGIFEDSIQAYQIGKNKYALSDLHAISATNQQKKYHEFATILRQHNVSGRENAFDKLVNLFLCKLVDEIENPDDLRFYWKGVAYDTHFDLMDRLQQLYQSGMDTFLGEEITYINQLDVSNALRFIRQDPDATQRAVWELFTRQKFFTNNDFSFIDVHNERLFYQNAEVLLKIIQMWQDIRLTEAKGHNQFLGDMFEGFLDQGVKQSEGQFFTPMPICRFILMSLPLEKMVQDLATPPMAIDYACGAGHFLTELALQLQPLLKQHKHEAKLQEYHKSMVGIEKEYRLSKVAKVATFMYGQKDIQICYGDGLINNHSAYSDIKDGHFDLLVANPPYSVKGFLETLPEDERKAYSLSDTINDPETAGCIETFFIERAKQLLKGEGVAAIILPSSILSNGGSSYIRVREILLQYFDIIAIAEFGSGTFGKTGTNTVTLFLRRKLTQPDTAEHFKERVAEWFKGTAASTHKAEAYKDGHLIGMYTTHINVPKDDYFSLLRGEASGVWQQHEHFQPYHDAFEKRTELKNLRKKIAFKALGKDDQQAEIAKRYLKYVRGMEQDKLYFFCLASDQANPVLIIRSPSATREIKQFLGYEWSSAKGDEGIKLIEDANGKHITTLYDGPDHDHPMLFNRTNPEKLSHYIGANFEDALGDIPEVLGEVTKFARLVHILDFSRESFDKHFTLTPKGSLFIKSSKFPNEKLAKLAAMLRRGKGTKYGNSTIQVIKSGQARGHFEFDFTERHYAQPGFKLDERKLESGDLLINSTGKGTAGRVTYFDLKGTYVADSHITILRTNDRLMPKFGLYSLERIGFKVLESLAQGASGQIELTLDNIGQIEIPLPPIAIQKEVVSQCEIIDAEAYEGKTSITEAMAAIQEAIEGIYDSAAPRKEIDKLLSSNPQYGLNEKMNEAGIGYKIFRMNEIIGGRMVDNGSMKCADISQDEFDKYRLNKGDLLFNRTNSIEHVGKTGLFDLDGDYCFASYLVRLIPDPTRIVPEFLVKMMNSQAFLAEARGKASKSINQSNINATVMKNIKVPVPSLAEQRAFVAKVKALEIKIAEARAIIDATPAKKAAVMKKYL